MRLIRIIVGTEFDRDGVNFYTTKGLEDQALELVAEALEGFTMYQGFGGWRGPLGLITERCFIIESYTEKEPGHIQTLAHLVGETLNQHSVLLDDGGKVQFIEVRYEH